MFKLSKKLSGILLFSLTQVNFVEAGVIDLGVLNDSIIASGSSITLGSQANIYGNVVAGGSLSIAPEANIYGSVATSGELDFGSEATIHKDACFATIKKGKEATIIGKSISGVCKDSTGIENEISSLNRRLADFSLGKDHAFSITETTTLEAGNYWIDDLELETGESLFISGDQNSKAVINVVGKALVGSRASIELIGGILAENVFFNFIDNAAYQTFHFGGSIISGTYISNSRHFSIGDGATLENTRFFSNTHISANVQDVKFGTVPVPEPGTWSLFFGLVIALVSFQYFRSRKSLTVGSVKS